MARVGLNVEERGAELYRRCILNTHLAYRTHFLGADFVHEFHGFNDAQRLVCSNLVANLNKSRFARSGSSIERAHHREVTQYQFAG